MFNWEDINTEDLFHTFPNTLKFVKNTLLLYKSRCNNNNNNDDDDDDADDDDDDDDEDDNNNNNNNNNGSIQHFHKVALHLLKYISNTNKGKKNKYIYYMARQILAF